MSYSSFKPRSKVSLKLTINLIIGAVTNIFHTLTFQLTSWPSTAVVVNTEQSALVPEYIDTCLQQCNVYRLEDYTTTVGLGPGIHRHLSATVQCIHIRGLHLSATVQCIQIRGLHLSATVQCIQVRGLHLSATVQCIQVRGLHLSATVQCIQVRGLHLSATVQCIQVRGLYYNSWPWSRNTSTLVCNSAMYTG